MKKQLNIFILCLLVACSNKTINKGDEIFIFFSIKNEIEERIDGNILPNGDTLPLRIIIGETYMLPEIERQIYNSKKGDEIEFTLQSQYAFGDNGLYYLNTFDTVYIVNPSENLTIKIKIL